MVTLEAAYVACACRRMARPLTMSKAMVSAVRAARPNCLNIASFLSEIWDLRRCMHGCPFVSRGTQTAPSNDSGNTSKDIDEGRKEGQSRYRSLGSQWGDTGCCQGDLLSIYSLCKGLRAFYLFSTCSVSVVDRRKRRKIGRAH